MDSWKYDTAEDLDQTMVERLRQFPRKPDMLVYGARATTAVAMRALMRVYHRLQVLGRENLPREGSYILVANHASHLDTLAILSALPLGEIHRVFPAAARDFFFVSVPRLAVASIVVNALPFDREANPRQSLNICHALLENSGNVLLLFPEGTRTTTGELGEFKAGIGLMLAGSPHPVLPCYVDGAYQAWPKGRRLPRPGRVRLVIGKPLDYSDLKRGKKSALHITMDLRQAIVALGESLS